jgi:hypothetical protein
VRRNLREFLDEMKQTHPNVLETMLSAMKNVDAPRLLDQRFLDLEEDEAPSEESLKSELFPVLAHEML